jgi:hypothetical protein
MGIETILLVFGIAAVIAIAVGVKKAKSKGASTRAPQPKSGPTFPRKRM